MRWLCDHGCVSIESISSVRRWSMLVIALTATLFTNVFINGAAFLIPTLHAERGLDLAKAGLAFIDAQLRHGGDADCVGLHR